MKMGANKMSTKFYKNVIIIFILIIINFSMINNVFGESDYSIKNKLYLNLFFNDKQCVWRIRLFN